MLDRLTPSLFHAVLEMAERGLLPDPAIRWGIRQICQQRLDSEYAIGRSAADFAAEMQDGPVAIDTQTANEQHYEVPTPFFQLALGPYLKYSACIFESPSTSLAEAERRTLELTCQRAGLENGMKVLDLGCGWGSFTRYVAEHYPDCQIESISNSRTQRAFIETECNRAGFAPVIVHTADASQLELGRDRFDRVVSIEMFEHMRNWGILFDRIDDALRPDGRFFMHVFCHRSHPYLFENEGEPDWMARHFFSGGIMPSYDLPGAIPSRLEVERHWSINGTHYARTLRAWLDRADANRSEIEQLFSANLSRSQARQLIGRWRIFFMACEELFAWNDGEEWFVGHYLLKRRPRS